MSRSPYSLAFAALLYGAIGLTANLATPIGAGAAELSTDDRANLKALRSGDMVKMVIHDVPRARIDDPFRDLFGNSVSLEDYAGKVVLLNFWATWCPPCRAEMPSLDNLAAELEGPDFALIAISTDRGGVDLVAQFFDDFLIENIKIMHDRSGKVARRAGMLGLPLTLVLDREGREIARLIGEARWDSPEAQELLERVIEMTAQGHT